MGLQSYDFFVVIFAAQAWILNSAFAEQYDVTLSMLLDCFGSGQETL